ncbi:pyridoxal-phosphate dependent enzyme [Legionella sp. W05-934-2]|uniref:pyridoxal-phosphate dependent enzyme n=1 Tax=Legionella sp. W05-934-2 TaxID=1198649 RepID=UPI003463505D
MAILHSRIHSLNNFPKGWYVKREDELSGAIRGNKLRKYQSIIPYLSSNNIQRLIIIAGPQSNNLLAALQIAREHRLDVTALLLKPWSHLNQGNFSASRLFLNEQDICWIDRDQWLAVDDYAKRLQSESKQRCFVLCEGAAVAQAFEGAMTLGDDILRNEEEAGIQFNHIVMDAGTGFSAIALAHWLKQHHHPAQLQVILMADDELIFRQKALQWLGYKPDNMICHYPHTAKAFGAVNQATKEEVRRTAIEEGFLLDPIYSAKLFLTVRQKPLQQTMQGNVLLIHSG